MQHAETLQLDMIRSHQDRRDELRGPCFKLPQFLIRQRQID